jgi:retron-type reverse transcriptase
MPKTYTHLWERVIDFENVYHAFREATKGKRYRRGALKFKNLLDENLIILINDLEYESYQLQDYRQFYVNEPKRRLISAPQFRDRVMHHALCQVIEPIFENRFVDETFACRDGRGTHASMKYVLKCARAAKRRWGNYYVLKGDIQHYFPTVDHELLKGVIRRNIADAKVLRLIDTIIDSYNTDGEPGKGIPIGALTSQLFANVYFGPVDHWIKEQNPIKYYTRYMDDFVIIHNDKNFLKELLEKLEVFLHDKLKLTINPKTAIYPGRHGIDFCGYRVWPSHVKPRKSTVKRAKRRFRKMSRIFPDNPGILEHAEASINSFLGYIKHCNGWQTTKSVLERILFKYRE